MTIHGPDMLIESSMRPAVRACVVLGLLLTALTLAAQEPDRFEIRDHEIYSPPFLDDARTQIGVPHAEIAYSIGGATRRPSAAEQYLTDSYRAYRSAGYAMPPLAPRITYRETGDRMFRAFQFDFPADFGAQTAGMLVEEHECGQVPDNIRPANLKNWIALDNSLRSQSRLRQMHTISHEMLHAFQFGHRLFYRDCPPGWIQEGLADAAANFLSRQRFPADWNRQTFPDMSSWRSYRIAFQDADDWLSDDHFRSHVAPLMARLSSAQGSATLSAAEDTGYHSSGFWQFLARRSNGKKAQSTDDVKSLLATWYPMMEAQSDGPIARSTGWLNLVNKYVGQHVKLEGKQDGNALYGWFPEFLTEYATWWEERNPGLKNLKEEWLKLAFGGCETVELKPGNAAASSQAITLTNLRKNSGRCIDVTLKGFRNPIIVKVKADFEDADPDQFHLGMAQVEAPAGSGKTVDSCWNHWDSKRLQCRRLGKAAESSKIWKSEQFSAQGLKLEGKAIDATVTYVFSNVALQMDKTATVDEVKLTFSTNYVQDEGDKSFAPPNSVRPLTPAQLSQVMTQKKETFYRLYLAAPVFPTNLFDIELNELKPGESPRCGGDGGQGLCAFDTGGDYLVKAARPVAFGQTGYIAAAVYKIGGNGPALLTTFCRKDADMNAVEILESGDDGLVVRIDADLCDQPGPDNDYCGRRPQCPVRDHLSTTFTLGLGREHFAESATVHLLTPGTRFDIDQYFRDGVPTEGPVSSSSDESESAGGPDSDAADSNADAGDPSHPVAEDASAEVMACDCSCEQRQRTEKQGSVLKARAAAGEDVSMDEIMALTRCSAECQKDYVICEYESVRQRRQIEQAERQAAAERAAAECDCSCEGLEALQAEGRKMQSEMAAGQPPSLERIGQVSQCMNTCQSALLQCLGQGSSKP
jgi:hypothetical protein